MLSGLVGFGILVAWAAADLPPLNDLENPQMNLSTQIISVDGVGLGNFYENQNRVFVPIHEISPFVTEALVATEDIRFYEHNGVDPMSLFTLIYRNILKGQRSGGSTLTMQLARNLYNSVGREQTAMRKIKELIVSAILERNFTKEEIIQAYLNSASFYGNTYGIEMGSQILFGKSARDLDQRESALMVGLLKGPSFYNPIRRPERATERRNVVFAQLFKYGFIEEDVKDSLRTMDLGLNYQPGGANQQMMTSYLLVHIKKWLEEWVKDKGLDVDLYRDGLKVYTTIDSRMQRHAEEAVKEHLTEHQKNLDAEFVGKGGVWKGDKKIVEDAIAKSNRFLKAKKAGLSKKEIDAQFGLKTEMTLWTWEGSRDTLISPRDSIIHYLKFLETGFMAIDPQSGQIRAAVGGINYGVFQYDHVFQSKRQVGSTFKPFLYTAAIATDKIKPCDKVLDIPVSFDLPDGKKWTPENSGGKGAGLITYTQGLAQSINRVSATLVQKVGAEKMCEYAHYCGIESKLDCVPSLCLGTTDLTVYEMVKAYATFSSMGVRHDPIFITRIEDRNGQVLDEFYSHEETVLDSATAYTICAMLMNVVDRLDGTAHRIRFKYGLTNQIGGKTGTTQNHKDGWFMGITPDLVAGAWVGCADERVHFKGIGNGQGAAMALPIWAKFFKKIYADKKIGMPQRPFDRPRGYNVQLDCPVIRKDSIPEDTDDLPWG